MTKKITLIGLGLFGLALLVRLPYLGDFMTIDEVKYLEAAGQFSLGLYTRQFHETYMFLQPGVTIAWVETIILWLRYLASNAPDMVVFVNGQMADLPNLVGTMRLANVILTSLTVAGIYWLACPLLGNWPAALGAALLATDPFFVAHSRIVNGDASAAGLMMLAFLAFAHLWQAQRWRMAALAGVFVGLALLSKIAALMIVPWLVGLAGLGFYRDRKWRFWLLALVVCGGMTALTFVLLWPAMWVAPFNTLSTVFFDTMSEGEFIEGQDAFFLGQVSHDPGWFFYPYAIAFRLTPVTILGVLAAIIWLWRGRVKTPDSSIKTMLVAALLVYVVFVFVAANSSPKKLDRYVIAVIPALTLLAGVGLSWLISELIDFLGERVQNHGVLLKNSVSLAFLLSLFIVVIQLSFVIANYPYVLTYYNPLLGGYAQAARQVPVGWGEGLEQAAAWINARPKSSDLLVSSWYGDMVRPYLKASLNDFSSNGKDQLAADYVIFYINQSQRQKPNPSTFNYFAQQEPVFQVDYRGTPYVWVYPAPRMQEVSGKAKIEGRAELLGYSWKPAAPTKGGASANLTLFLRTLGPLPDNETFDIAVTSGDGTLWGEWLPATKVSWQPDTIVEWQGELKLPAEAPPGDYNLVVRLMDTNLDSEVTRFPLEETVLTLYE